MSKANMSSAYWIIIVFLVLSILLILAGQSLSLFNYDLTVRLGLQESRDQVGDYGVEVNRGFGAGDTVVYIPLMAVSLIGLLLKKRWSLLTLAAFFGVSVYWSVTICFMLFFFPGLSSYNYAPGLEIWLFLGVYMIFGIWGLLYLVFRGNALLNEGD